MTWLNHKLITVDPAIYIAVVGTDLNIMFEDSIIWKVLHVIFFYM